jgi:hypothetical protein
MGFLDYRYLRGLNGISPTNLLGSIGVWIRFNHLLLFKRTWDDRLKFSSYFWTGLKHVKPTNQIII